MATQPISLWDKSAQESDYSAEMDGDQTADIAIVGGGFTGLSTALHASERGQDCIVLEKNQIGFGGSGRNVGLVNAGLWLPPRQVSELMGEEVALKLIDVLGNAPDYVFSLIERYKIACEPHRSGTIHAAHSPKGYEDLARRAEDWHRLGAPVDLLSRAEAAEKIGTNGFYGGLLDHRAGTINPMGYVRGLARAARDAGARIRTGVEVQKIQRDGDQWCLMTSRGRVRAKKVVLGTNGYTDGLWPQLQKTITVIHYFQLATKPFGEKAAHILKEGQGLWDTGTIMFSVRRDNFGRIIVGSMGSVIGGLDGLSKRWARKRLETLFPELGEIEFESAWHGNIAMTPDHLPRIHRLADNLYTPIGYNGRGITPGTVFGKALAELLSGANDDTLPMPLSEPKIVKNRALMTGFYRFVFAANQLVKSISR